MSRSNRRFSRWLQRVMDADERYICSACDDRFAGRTEGIVHVVQHHPEYSVALAKEPGVHGRTPAANPCPAPALTPRPLLPTPLWS